VNIIEEDKVASSASATPQVAPEKKDDKVKPKEDRKS
jgi:hypothetical protein